MNRQRHYHGAAIHNYRGENSRATGRCYPKGSLEKETVRVKGRWKEVWVCVINSGFAADELSATCVVGSMVEWCMGVFAAVVLLLLTQRGLSRWKPSQKKGGNMSVQCRITRRSMHTNQNAASGRACFWSRRVSFPTSDPNIRKQDRTDIAIFVTRRRDNRKQGIRTEWSVLLPPPLRGMGVDN